MANKYETHNDIITDLFVVAAIDWVGLGEEIYTNCFADDGLSDNCTTS